MPWQETSPGRFERPLDTIEYCFKTLGTTLGAPWKMEHYTVTITAKFKADLPAGDIEAALRQAWKIMRHDHPEIASVAEGHIKVYEVANEESLKEWLAKTFIVEPDTATPESLFANFKPNPLATFHYLPHSSEILIHTSHWRIDGMGAIGLLQNFFKAFASPRDVTFGHEGESLSPGLDEMVGFVQDQSPEADAASTALVMEYFGNLPTISLPTQESQTPGPTHRTQLVLGPKTTAALVAACKANGLSVGSAFQAAAAMVTQELDPTKPVGKKFVSFGPINYRPYLPPQYNNPPVSVVMLGLPLTLTPSSFSETAIQAHKFYKQPLSVAETNFQTVIASHTLKFATIATTPPPPGTPIPSEPALNSVGNVDAMLPKKYGDKVEIDDFWLGVEMLTRQINLYVWTWQERMVVSGCYNSHFFTDPFTMYLYRKCVEILVRNLNVEVLD